MNLSMNPFKAGSANAPALNGFTDRFSKTTMFHHYLVTTF